MRCEVETVALGQLSLLLLRFSLSVPIPPIPYTRSSIIGGGHWPIIGRSFTKIFLSHEENKGTLSSYHVAE